MSDERRRDVTAAACGPVSLSQAFSLNKLTDRWCLKKLENSVIFIHMKLRILFFTLRMMNVPSSFASTVVDPVVFSYYRIPRAFEPVGYQKGAICMFKATTEAAFI